MILRIHISGAWSATQFQNFLEATERLYVLHAIDGSVIERWAKLGMRERQDFFERFHRHADSDVVPYVVGHLMSSLSRAKTPSEFWLGLSERPSSLRFASEMENTIYFLGELSRLYVPRATSAERDWLRSQRSIRPQAKLLLSPSVLGLDNQLKVRRLQYASPGFGDFGGLAEALTAVKDVLVRIIDVWNQRGEQKRKEQLLDEQILEARIRNENARLDLIEKRLKILERYGLEPEDQERLRREIYPAIRFLEAAAQSGVLTGTTIEKDG